MSSLQPELGNSPNFIVGPNISEWHSLYYLTIHQMLHRPFGLRTELMAIITTFMIPSSKVGRKVDRYVYRWILSGWSKRPSTKFSFFETKISHENNSEIIV